MLRREYTTQFLILTVFPLLDVFTDRIVEGRWVMDVHWGILFALSLLLYLGLRWTKRNTRLIRRRKFADAGSNV